MNKPTELTEELVKLMADNPAYKTFFCSDWGIYETKEAHKLPLLNAMKKVFRDEYEKRAKDDKENKR
jgi:hypothetical protein